MIRKKRLNAESLNSLGKALVRIAGRKELSEKGLSSLHRQRFRNQFVYSFFAGDAWFCRRYIDAVQNKLTVRTLLNRMRKRLVKTGKARNQLEADALIEKKMAQILAKKEKVKKTLWAQRARNPIKENQIAHHQMLNAFTGIVTVCDDIQYNIRKTKHL